MTSEDPPSNNSSPRLSFSHDLIQPDNPSSPRRPVNFPKHDFDFNFSIEVAATADELFSYGKILPLPLRNPNPTPNPNPDPDPISGPGSENGAVKKSLWKLGRSASLNCVRSGMSKIMFLRSYSAGSDPHPKPQPQPQPRPHPNPKPRRIKNTKKGYYFEGDKKGVCGNSGSRTNPVPLFPKQRGVIGFLLCNCVGGGGGGSRGMEYYHSP